MFGVAVGILSASGFRGLPRPLVRIDSVGFIIKTCLWLLLLLAIGLGVAGVMMVQNESLVPEPAEMTAADLQQARLFLQNADPRQLAPGEISELTIQESDLRMLLNYLLENLYGGGSEVDFTEGRAALSLSARLPDNPLGQFLNVRMTLAQQSDVVVLEDLQVGSLALPGWFADAFMRFAHAELKRRVPEYLAGLQAIDDYSIDAAQLNIVYQWQPELLEQISSRGRDFLVSPAVKERLLAHAEQLAKLTNNPDLPRSISAARLLGPMFAFARSRGGDPVEENRAAIMALSLYMMDIDFARVLGEEGAAASSMGRHRLTLSRRIDFAQHFLISAGLTSTGGTGMADAIGLLKEMDDLDPGGSGFSFNDLGADRAGVRFAELALADHARARQMQELLAGELEEAFFMPDFKGLPEYLSDAELSRDYGGVGEPAYNAVLADIEERINATPLFRILAASE